MRAVGNGQGLARPAVEALRNCISDFSACADSASFPQPSAEDSGLSLRCINELFALIHSRQSSAAAHPSSNGGDDASHVRFVVKCSFIQIYQESVFDLLSDSQPQYVAVSHFFFFFFFFLGGCSAHASFVMQLQGAGCE